LEYFGAFSIDFVNGLDESGAKISGHHCLGQTTLPRHASSISFLQTSKDSSFRPLMLRHKLSGAGWHSFHVADPSVWNFSATYLRDPAFELSWHQLETFWFARY